MSTATVPIGSVSYWGMMRLAQVALICIGLFVAFLERHSMQWELGGILVLWFLFAAYLDTEVYGYADENGVHFRRYFSMQFVPWTNVSRVSWFRSNILAIHLGIRNPLRRELNANSYVSRSIFYDLEGEPELVRWLLVAKPTAADGMELRPWGTETAASQKMSAVLKILIPIISAAILIWLAVAMYLANG